MNLSKDIVSKQTKNSEGKPTRWDWYSINKRDCAKQKWAEVGMKIKESFASLIGIKMIWKLANQLAADYKLAK